VVFALGRDCDQSAAGLTVGAPFCEPPRHDEPRSVLHGLGRSLWPSDVAPGPVRSGPGAIGKTTYGYQVKYAWPKEQ
jgi:hypothetical protein